MPSCKVTTCPSLPTGSLVPENHIPWARLALQSRMILGTWVGDTYMIDECDEMRTRPSCLNGTLLMRRSLGVIPRAASALFERLAGPPTLRRSESSALRTPTRYSVQSTMGLAALAKVQAQENEDKDWQMKATYVEVRMHSPRR